MPHAEHAAEPTWRTGLFTPANKWASGGIYGEVDWNDPDSLRTWSGRAGGIVKRIDRELGGEGYSSQFLDRVAGAQGTTGFQSSGAGMIGLGNPYHAQGLGPSSFAGQTWRSQVLTHRRWYEAQQGKFQNRIAELGHIERAGGQEEYEQELADRHLLSRPQPEAARAAELLRLDRRGGGARGGQAGPSEGRLAARARTAEQRRSSSRDQSTGGGGGGGSSRRVLRARNVLEPLGLRSGQASARTLLG